MTGALPPRTFEEMVELLDDLNVSLEGSTPTGTRYTLFASEAANRSEVRCWPFAGWLS